MINAKNKKIRLWAPDTSATLSLLFTPIFGAFLHTKNWEELQEEKKAKDSKRWLYVSIFIVFLSIGITLLGGNSTLINLIFFLLWYFIIAKKQTKYIKNNSIEYEKKSIFKPLFIATTLIFFLVLIISFLYTPTNVDIEKESSKLVSEILKDNLNSNIKCKSVSIIKKVSNTFYNAEAYLDNEEKLNITIELKENNILVTILNSNNKKMIDTIPKENSIDADDAHISLEESTLDTTPRLIELIKQTESIKKILILEKKYNEDIINQEVTEEIIRDICSHLYNGGFCEGDSPEDILDIGRENINYILNMKENITRDEENDVAPIKINFEKEFRRNPFGDGVFISSTMTLEYMTITSIVNSLNINNIILNRGNCKYKQERPITLKYGEFKKIFIPSKCHLLQIDIETNQGTWTFKR